MPSQLNAPVLTLDVAKIDQVNPRDIASLKNFWTVFNQCSQNIKDGRRLENMSWRLWARETLCCPAQPDQTIVPSIEVPRRSQVPSLSNSVASDDGHSENEDTPQQRSRQRSYSSDEEDSALSRSRGNESHLSADTLKKIVVGIQAKEGITPLSPAMEASIPPLKTLDAEMSSRNLAQEAGGEEDSGRQMHNSTDSCISGTTAATSSTNTTRPSDHRNSDTSVSSGDGLIRSGSVVHGFSPVSTSFRAKPSQGLPMPQPSKLAPQPAKKQGMFQLGVSSEDDDSSFEAKIPSYRPHQRSSLSQSITKQQLQRGLEKKTTSFRDIVEQRRMDSDAGDDEGAIASSDEEDDESAIDDEDDDEGDWEDSPSDDDKPAALPSHRFPRVESRPDLVSRPSMLSMQLHQNRRISGLQNENSRSQPAFRRSRTSSPNGPSMPSSPEDHDDEPGLMMQGTKTKAKPIIMTTTNAQQGMAHSPRTARQQMLATELSQTLRRNLLWERQQKSQAANAFLKRSRNALSMANLQTAGGHHEPQENNNQSWNQDFENPWEFNAKGW